MATSLAFVFECTISNSWIHKYTFTPKVSTIKFRNVSPVIVEAFVDITNWYQKRYSLIIIITIQWLFVDTRYVLETIPIYFENIPAWMFIQNMNSNGRSPAIHNVSLHVFFRLHPAEWSLSRSMRSEAPVSCFSTSLKTKLMEFYPAAQLSCQMISLMTRVLSKRRCFWNQIYLLR